MWKGAARPGCRWAVVLCLVVSAGLTTPRPGQGATAYAPSPDEVALLVLANEARVKSGLTPYVWSDALGAAALAHSVDMATHDCFQHDSCNGETWWKRIARYYPSWTNLAENIGGGGTPRMMHDVWMGSPGHRAAILGAYAEFGAAIVLDQYKTSYATEDFGRSGAALSYPTVPAAAVVPRVGYPSDERELLLNYHPERCAARGARSGRHELREPDQGGRHRDQRDLSGHAHVPGRRRLRAGGVRGHPCRRSPRAVAGG